MAELPTVITKENYEDCVEIRYYHLIDTYKLAFGIELPYESDGLAFEQATRDINKIVEGN